ncbi:TorF family putative porin [Thiomicrorhabdus sp. Kp2]|uniref:TorF family putative porin n=1 Tax=Thiomicrorhabdus sp. Kp2 TaxID=1123518 RepID=UPI000426D92D|nr:TorF family putative porin [Thiomicrorhabdus sp. Kp2]
MTKTFKLKSLALSLAVAGAASVAMVPATSQAGVSANIGMVSNYVFRGVEQTESASASAGLDFESDSGFYIGTWAADVESGLEYDLYAGWGGEFEGISLGLGASGYYYTDTAFDSAYEEVNASIGYGMFTLGYDKGVYKPSAGDVDYDHKYVSVAYNDFSATLGLNDGDIDTSDDALTYIDLGYSTELAAGFDGSINLIATSSEDSATKDQSYLVLGVSKSFDLM